MDTRTGEIYTPEEFKALKERFRIKEAEEELKYLKEMQLDPTKEQLARKPPKVGRNDLCPCASGKKFKECCLERKTFKRTYR
jgi:uncharacterized protein YecA (UPF0149 family)